MTLNTDFSLGVSTSFASFFYSLMYMYSAYHKESKK